MPSDIESYNDRQCRSLTRSELLDWRFLQSGIEFDVECRVVLGLAERGDLVDLDVKMPPNLPNFVIDHLEALTFSGPHPWWHKLLRAPRQQYHLKYDHQERNFRII